MTRSSAFTAAKIKPEFYSDFLSSFSLNPQTGFIEMVTNEDSVKQSIENLVLTNIFERYYQPLVGSKVQSLNFEMLDDVTVSLLQTTITETINNFEPRVKNLKVIIDGSAADQNQISITIIFTLQNLTQPIQFTLLLPRVR